MSFFLISEKFFCIITVNQLLVKIMSSSILNYWSFENKTPRPNQVKALEWIETNKDKKFFILQAPVGSGKSLCGITASKFLTGNKQGNSFILTPQKILQEQYEKDFVASGIAFSLYGKSNYKCVGKNTNCAIGSLFKPVCPSCPYNTAKKKAVDSPNVVLNYKLALTSFGYTENFKRRKLMILDECHTLEQFLVDFDAIEITKFSVEKRNINWINTTNLTSVVEWALDVYLPSLEKYFNELEETCQLIKDQRGGNPSAADLKTLAELDYIGDLLDSLLAMKFVKKEALNDEFVLIHTPTSYTIKRITGVSAFKTILLPQAEKFLFMSATILDPQAFCRDLGIDVKQTTFLSLDSDFPVENRPICFIPTMKMNASWNDKSSFNIKGRVDLITNLKKVLNIHKDESGIIHTANFQVATWLVNELQGKIPQQIYHHNPESKDDRGAVIRAFTGSKKPGILISPSITEGLDLKEDLGRFAIFVKIAFPFLGDQWIIRRKEISNEWYTRKTIIDVMQGCGRVVRSETDVGHVYILDTSFDMLLNSTKHLLPKWWLDSIQRL